MPVRFRTDRCSAADSNTVSGAVADRDATAADANTDSDSYGNCYSSGDSDIYSHTCPRAYGHTNSDTSRFPDADSNGNTDHGFATGSSGDLRTDTDSNGDTNLHRHS